jgi:hypothetical protein
MVAAANKVAVVVEKRIIGTMRANNGEGEAVGWNDLQKVKRVTCREAGKSIFSTQDCLLNVRLPTPTRSSRRMCLVDMSEGGLREGPASA